MDIKTKEAEEPIKDLDNLKPIDHAVIAYPHTPVYKMHRYFARRPWSVFNELIQHYSNPGSIILDPFCGGGVTVVEGLKLKRKVIGVDINQMATFITKMEAVDANWEEMKDAFSKVSAEIKNKIEELYLTECPKCKNETPAEWFEWSNVYKCPNCNKPIQISDLERVSPGKYICNYCKNQFKTGDAKKLEEELIRIKTICPICNSKTVRPPTKKDKNHYKLVKKIFYEMDSTGRLAYPKTEMPMDFDMRRPYNLMYKRFVDFFTERNLLALSLLFLSIEKIKTQPIRNLMFMTFSSTLDWCSRISRVVQGSAREITTPTYWVPNQPAENNVWRSFEKRFDATLKGKKYSGKIIGDYFRETNSLDEIVSGDANCILLTKSSTSLPFKENSLDAIITDPPYGGNIMYTELSDFWSAWLDNVVMINKEKLIVNKEEAIVSKYQGKGIREYRDLLYKIFSECYRVLKPRRWMVLTFHNKEFKVWNALHLAAHDAGFILPEENGMIYQPPIQAYITTLYQKRGGAMLGDFILSFQKGEKIPEKKMIEYVDIGRRIQELAAETIQYHDGATLSQIYMRLIPFLINKRKLEEIKEIDLPKYFNSKFEEKNGKWYFKEKMDYEIEVYLRNYNKVNYDEETALLDFVPVEAKLETIIRWTLIKKGSAGATQDEIQNAVYTRLINGNAADYGEISRVLGRIAKLTPTKGQKRKVWVLKEDLAQQMLLEEILKPKEKEVLTEKEQKTREMSEHDLMIFRFLELGEYRGYGCHVGLKEQGLMLEFKKRSEPMLSHTQYGMDKHGFDIIREIDMLWLKGDYIVAAFEVEKSTTIDSGINRFRNLFAIQPNSKIDAYIVVPDKRETEAIKKLNSPANRKDELNENIKVIKFSDLNIQKSLESIKINL